MNGYRCFACAETQPADFNGFLCPACGGNLEITYDYVSAGEKIRQSLGDGPRDIFSYAPLLPVSKLDTPFPLRVGGTPLYAAPRLGASTGLSNLYFKDETLNPSASTKDRASAVAVQRATDIGATAIATASTGNAGSSLACLAAAIGQRAIVFVPERAPVAKLTQLLSFGATVLAVRGNYDDAFDLCLAACDEFGWFNRSTGYNPFTREGKKTCSYEIWQNLGGQVPDRVVVPTGDGNLLSGIWKGWCDLQAAGFIERLPKIDCAQSETSAAISHTVHRLCGSSALEVDWSKVAVDEVEAATVADSIAVNQPRDGLAAVKAVVHSSGEAVTVPDEDILAAIPAMASGTGIFPEPAAAAPFAAVKQMLENNTIRPDERVVCIVSGSGLKDVEHARMVAGSPLLVDPSLDAVRDALAPGGARQFK